MKTTIFTLVIALLPLSFSFAADSFSNKFNGKYTLISSHDHEGRPADFKECSRKITISTSNNNATLNMFSSKSDAQINFENGCNENNFCVKSSAKKYETFDHYTDDGMNMPATQYQKIEVSGNQLIILGSDGLDGVLGMVFKAMDRLSNGSNYVKCVYKRN